MIFLTSFTNATIFNVFLVSIYNTAKVFKFFLLYGWDKMPFSKKTKKLRKEGKKREKKEEKKEIRKRRHTSLKYSWKMSYFSEKCPFC